MAFSTFVYSAEGEGEQGCFTLDYYHLNRFIMLGTCIKVVEKCHQGEFNAPKVLFWPIC